MAQQLVETSRSPHAPGRKTYAQALSESGVDAARCPAARPLDLRGV
jgi:hypothetical protein